MAEPEELHKQYIESMINPILEEIVTQMLVSKPSDPPTFMLEYLLNKSGKKAALSSSEKEELHNLRKEVANLRQQVSHEEHEKSGGSETEEEEDDIMDDLPVAVQQKKGPRASVSAEAYGSWNQKEAFKPRVIQKIQEQKERILDKLSRAFMFQALDESEVQIVIDAMEERVVRAGEAVIRQGEDGAEMYVVDAGKLECTKLFKGESAPKKLKEYYAGDAFGELSLLYNAPRAANIIALEESVLWCLDRGTFNNIVKEAAIKKREKYEEFMSQSSLFKETDPYERSKIADAFKSVSFPPNEYVVREGDWGDIFYIIEEGRAKATKTLEPGQPPQDVKQYSEGDYFGELALLKGEPRAANIVSLTQLKCATLDRHSFKRLLGPLEEILKRNSATYQKYMKK